MSKRGASKLLEDPVSEAGLSFEVDVAPWLGNQAALFLLGGSGGELQQPSGAALVATTDIDATRAAIDKALAAQDPAIETTTETYEGVDYQLESDADTDQGAYICGEESALLDALEGKRGNPRLKPPFPANQGLYQGPTLINNVETLCNAPAIIGKGAEWFAAMGVDKSTGTKVVSVSGNVRRPGNYEVELGITAREIVEGIAGGPEDGRSVKCWFPGGSSAPVLLEEHLDLPYTFEAMAEAGSMLGSGAIIVVDDQQPIVPLALRLAEFYRHESCGKCVPCREGTNWTVKTLERIDEGEATPMDLEIMAEVQTNIIGNCLCVLGDSMAMPIGSMIKHFRPEFEEHIERARERRDREDIPAFGAGELAAAAGAGPA